MALSPGVQLGPYEILSPLAAGGMGEVYRARDTRLDRDVAIKILPVSVSAEPEAIARFEREAKAVAALSHPNILAIHDFGTQDGVAYAVMELLEGETLRAKLAAAPIPHKQAVDYALQVAKGLSAAHDKGIVHRDLKPENLFVTKDGHLKILDFGLAKKIGTVAPAEETSAPTVSGHTEPGTVMGTVGYMSPEQVRGLPVDGRSDIFSFGTILYELFSGKRAFQRDTVGDTMAAIMRDEPPELSESVRNISSALDHIVRHCMEKDRDRRFHSAHDVAFALSEASGPPTTSGASLAALPAGKRKVLFAGLAVVVLAVAGTYLLWRFHGGVGEAARVKRVAVLPFENLGSPDDDYFADGIADAVRGKLTSVPGIVVIARGSSILYKKTTKTPNRIADELDARYLLTATVRWQKSGDSSRVQVSPELVEVKDSGAPASKWQQPFDASLTDVFQVQSEIATKVAQSLGVALGAVEEKRLSASPTKNLAAYDAFLKGEEAVNREGVGPASLRRAISFYEEAVALDPTFAQAWGEVSHVLSLLYYAGTPTPEIAKRAREATEKLSALAPHSSDEYLATGRYALVVDHDYSRAVAQFENALRLAPLNPDVLFSLALAERALGRWSKAVEHVQQAERLDPRRPSIKMMLVHRNARIAS